MKLTKFIFKRNWSSYLFLFIAFIFWAFISVPIFAQIENIYLPLETINRSYYDKSCYISSINRDFNKDTFEETLKILNSQKGYIGSDYIFYNRNEEFLTLGDGKQRNLQVCSQHLGSYFGIDKNEMKNGKIIAVGYRGMDNISDIHTLNLPNEKITFQILKLYSSWQLVPMYNKHHYEPSGQLIFSSTQNNIFLIGFDDLLKSFDPKDLIYPTSFTAFFDHELTGGEIDEINKKIGGIAIISDIKTVRENTQKQAITQINKRLVIPIMGYILLFFTSLSIILLSSYKSRDVVKVLRLNGMSRNTINKILAAPFAIINLLTTILFIIFLIYIILNPNFDRISETTYNFRVGIYFTVLQILQFIVVYIFVSKILNYEERKGSIYDKA